MADHGLGKCRIKDCKEHAKVIIIRPYKRNAYCAYHAYTILDSYREKGKRIGVKERRTHNED